jgi:hypothetical protein
MPDASNSACLEGDVFGLDSSWEVGDMRGRRSPETAKSSKRARFEGLQNWCLRDTAR